MAQQKRAANELAAEQRQKTRHQVQIPAGPIEIRNLSLVEGPPPSLAKNTEVDLESAHRTLAWRWAFTRGTRLRGEIALSCHARGASPVSTF